MRIILSLLMCFVFVQAQTAFARGPWQVSGGGVANVGGTWAGVFTSPNSLGLFTFAVPSGGQGGQGVGLSTGDVYFFDGTTGQGGAFQGFIVGVANPNEAKFSGQISMQAGHLETVLNGQGQPKLVSEINGLASGKVKAEFAAATSGRGAAVLTGTASITPSYLQYDPISKQPAFFAYPTIDLTVDGFQQSGTEGSTVSHSTFNINGVGGSAQ